MSAEDQPIHRWMTAEVVPSALWTHAILLAFIAMNKCISRNAQSLLVQLKNRKEKTKPLHIHIQILPPVRLIGHTWKR